MASRLISYSYFISSFTAAGSIGCALRLQNLRFSLLCFWMASTGTKFEGNEDHTHTDPISCVFCALKVTFGHGSFPFLLHCASNDIGMQSLFVAYEFSDERMIPPNDVRTALALQFADESRFQIGEMVRFSTLARLCSLSLSLIACKRATMTTMNFDIHYLKLVKTFTCSAVRRH